MISIDWGTRVINVPQSYLTNVSGAFYQMDVDQFRLDLKDLEDDEEGMPFLDTHTHNTEVVLGGVTYARTINIINDYTVTFEDGSYAVTLFGANHNVSDVTNLNSVSIRTNNSAGLISTTQTTEVITGVTFDAESINQITSGVWESGINVPMLVNQTSIDSIVSGVSTTGVILSQNSIDDIVSGINESGIELTSGSLQQIVTEILSGSQTTGVGINTQSITDIVSGVWFYER